MPLSVPAVHGNLRTIKMLSLLRTIRIGFNFSKLKPIDQLLKTIKTEDGKDLLQSGSVVGFSTQQDQVNIQLRLDRDYRRIRSLIQEQLMKEGYKDIKIGLASKEEERKKAGQSDARKGHLKNVKRVIAVSSCKGGVGKSTVAINIACTLKELGLKVGIFDADIFGPSLPTLIGKEGTTLLARPDDPKSIEPIDFDGLKCMSFGFAANKPAVMRGPMVSSVVQQLLYQTYWQDLDYLIIDMPPGTGDIQITVCQEVKLDGAVIVTTPQKLAFVDVVKGIQMFNDLKVRILGVVENMAYHECPKCKSRDQVFGKGYHSMLVQQFGIKNSVQIPLNSDISKFSDMGSPVVLTLPRQHTVFKGYVKLINYMISEVDKPFFVPNVYFNKQNSKVVIETEAEKREIDPYEMRTKCKCAACIDEFTGVPLLKKESIPKDVHPVRMEEKGNYAVAVVWSDGHRSSIYPFQRLLGSDFDKK